MRKQGCSNSSMASLHLPCYYFVETLGCLPRKEKGSGPITGVVLQLSCVTVNVTTENILLYNQCRKRFFCAWVILATVIQWECTKLLMQLLLCFVTFDSLRFLPAKNPDHVHTIIPEASQACVSTN